MSATWRLLNQTPSDTQLPPLLISTTFTSNSYSVNVTDLTYIWSESLDRRSIIKRSLDENTSIDPSEDAQQLRVFLEKIQSALSGGVNTSLSLQAKSSLKSNNPPALDMYITAKLPKGLQPLEWTLRLSLLPQIELSLQLTIPILRSQNARMREMEKLIEILRDKDHVIQKLIDKLETSGAELGHVFPGAAGKGGRKIPRKLAEERVKGLGMFEIEEWKKEMRLMEKDAKGEDVELVLKQVYEDAPTSLLDLVTYSEAPGNRLNWWEYLKDDPVEVSSRTAGQEGKKDATTASEGQRKNEATPKEEDDFQVQATPPHLGKDSAKSADASLPPTLRSQTAIQDSTDDEDDLDAPSQRSIIPDSVQLSPPKQQPRKLGAIGRPKPAPTPAAAPETSSRSKSPAPQAETNGKHPMIDDDETASEDDDIPPPAKSPTPPKRTSPAPPKAKEGGLGKIGGKAKEATPPVARAAPADNENPTTEHKPKRKLGIIGHKASTPARESDKQEETRGQGADMATEEKEEPEETPLERADRKREELKRALEEKAKAPVRKKRKF
jgi:hypothetical protein